MTYYSPEEWRAEAKRRFGDNPKNWKFICPRCGNIASGAEYFNAGAEPDDMYQCCIGRFGGARGCDWAAFGLFGVLGKGDIVVMPDGKQLEVFAMALPSPADQKEVLQ